MNVFYAGTPDIILVGKVDHKESAIMNAVLGIGIISKVCASAKFI
jgi:hypothetical protein